MSRAVVYSQAWSCFTQGNVNDGIMPFVCSAQKFFRNASFTLALYLAAGAASNLCAQERIEDQLDKAHRGDAMAQYAMGHRYHQGIGVVQSDEMALWWFQQAADQGVAVAQYKLAQAYAYGRGVHKDLEKALQWYRVAAAQNHEPAVLGLAEIELNREGGDPGEAARLYKIAAEMGSPLACRQLGQLYREGRGVPQDDTAAREYFTLGAERGDADAQALLADAYERGLGVERSASIASYWHHKAAENGAVSSMTRLGRMYERGEHLHAQSYRRAFDWYLAAAQAGNAEAQYALARFYNYGFGVEQRAQQYHYWLRQAAESGLEKAQLELGLLFITERRDLDDAVVYVRRAAQLGLPEAQVVYARILERGELIEKSLEEARRWFQLAADNGSAEGQYSLAQFLAAHAEGFSDREIGLEWLRSSAAAQYPAAMRELGKRYRAGDQIQSDEMQARSWLQASAEAGDAEARYLLGVLIEESAETADDFRQALLWYRLAAEENFPRAFYRLGLLYQSGQGLEKSQHQQAQEYFRRAQVGGVAEAERWLNQKQLNAQNYTQEIIRSKSAPVSTSASQTDVVQESEPVSENEKSQIPEPVVMPSTQKEMRQDEQEELRDILEPVNVESKDNKEAAEVDAE